MQRGLERHWGKARAQQALRTLARSGPRKRWCGPGCRASGAVFAGAAGRSDPGDLPDSVQVVRECDAKRRRLAAATRGRRAAGLRRLAPGSRNGCRVAHGRRSTRTARAPEDFPPFVGGAGPKSLDASTPHGASPPAGHGMLHLLARQGTVAKPPRPVHVVAQVKRSHYKSTLQHACRRRGCNVCAQSMQYSVNESLDLRGHSSLKASLSSP